MANEDQNLVVPKWVDVALKNLKFFFGISVEKKYQLYQTFHMIFYACACTINIIGCMVAIANNSSHKAKFVVTVLAMFHSILTIIYCYIITVVKRDKVDTIASHYTANDPEYLGVRTVALHGKFVKNDLIRCGLFYGTSVALLFFFVLLWFKSQRGTDLAPEIDELRHYMMPFWFSCGDRANTSSLTRFCWKVRNNDELLFCNSIQVILFGYETIHLFCGVIGIFSMTRAIEAKGMVFQADIKLIERTTDNITECAISAKPAYHRRQCILKYDREIENRFKMVYKEQQRIRRFVGEVMGVFREEIFVGFFANFLFLMLEAAGVFAEKNGDIYFRLRSAMVCLLALYVDYIICESIHHIYEVNDIISEALYDFCWYQQSMKFKKLFLISQTLNQGNLAVKIHDYYVVNLKYFADNLKRSYSVLGMLRLKSSAN